MAEKMLSRWIWTMGDRGKALAIVSTIILLLSFTFLYYGVSQHNKTIDLLIDKVEKDIHITVNQVRRRSLIDYEKRLQTFLEVQPKIVQAFAGRDRERLYALALPKFNILKKENSYFTSIHFHLPDGRSFLRVHEPDRWGDDLTEIRPSLLRIHEEKKVDSGFEIGTQGGFFRTLAPVFFQERYVGAVEFGLDMHQAVEIVQNGLHMQTTSYFHKDEWEKASEYTKFTMVRRGSFLINSHGNPIYDKLPLDLSVDEELHTQVEIDGSHYVVHTHLVFEDFNDNTVGGLIILQDITELIANKKEFLVRAVLFTLFLLLLGFGALHLSFNRLLGAMSREIAKRKEAESLYRESKVLLECMIDSIPDMIYYKDTSGAYLGCNTAFANLTGHSCEFLMGRTDSELFPPEMADFFALQDQETLAKGGPSSYENWVGQDDSSKYLHTLKSPYQGPDNKMIGVIGISRDLTDYRQATDALKRAAQEWAAAMDADPDCLYSRS